MSDNRLKNENLILDFTHVYCDEYIRDIDRFRYIDCSDIEETDMYCSKEAYNRIWDRIKSYGVHGIHYIDSGNYHYITKIITDHIDEPFGLIMYDHHTDMQRPMVSGMMSCGDWAGLALSQNENLRQLVIVGPPEKDIEQAVQSYSETERSSDAVEEKGDNIPQAAGQDIVGDRLLTFSDEELHSGVSADKLELIRDDIPLYISIDKDVFAPEYSETNWSQGDMSIGELERLLSIFLGGQDVMNENGEIRHTRILGVDICGESQTDIPVPEYLEAEEKNQRVNTELFQFISEHVRRFR